MSSILITGASKGIGLGTALYFARKAHAVFAGVRDPNGSVELKQAIAREQLPITLVTLDIDDDESVVRGVKEVQAKSGQIDVLVNNAGISAGGAIEDVPIAAVQRVFNTNYLGSIRMIQAVVPDMRARRSGTIINISSMYGRLVWATHAHYSATKHALEAASEALAQELRAYDIRVAIVEPGLILTPMAEAGRARRAANPLDPANPYVDLRRRFGKLHDTMLDDAPLPELVAEAIEYAISTDTPRLRYLVGDDAEAMIGGREQTSDEEWVDNGLPMSDDEYYDLMQQRFGVDLFR